ncbi:MAG: Radical domain protein [Firmicutes bacterium]|nr:Radical domain protein [Bacillota bacterium]
MYFDNAEGMVFRPPSEANSLILRVTIGCSHNACTFCGMYHDTAFRIRPEAEVTALIERAAALYPYQRRIFLADGNALILPTDRLLKIMHHLAQAFPKLARITCYGGPHDILRKTPEELAALRNAGLHIIYLGIESGDDEVLSAVNKGVTAAQMSAAGQKVIAAGIKLSGMIILGLGGKDRTNGHAINTAKIINEINPTMLGALTLMLHEGSPMRQAAENGEFYPLSPYELMLELKEMVAHINVTQPCIFRSTHISNFLPLAGTLPKDKDLLLTAIDQVLDVFRNQTSPTYNARNQY